MSPLSGKRVLLYRGGTDFRLGINGLTRLVGRPREGCAYVFCSKSGSSLKILWYERSSVWLAQARLGAGRFQFPSGEGSAEVAAKALLSIVEAALANASIRMGKPLCDQPSY